MTQDAVIVESFLPSLISPELDDIFWLNRSNKHIPNQMGLLVDQIDPGLKEKQNNKLNNKFNKILNKKLKYTKYSDYFNFSNYFHHSILNNFYCEKKDNILLNKKIPYNVNIKPQKGSTSLLFEKDFKFNFNVISMSSQQGETINNETYNGSSQVLHNSNENLSQNNSHQLEKRKELNGIESKSDESLLLKADHLNQDKTDKKSLSILSFSTSTSLGYKDALYHPLDDLQLRLGCITDILLNRKEENDPPGTLNNHDIICLQNTSKTVFENEIYPKLKSFYNFYGETNYGDHTAHPNSRRQNLQNNFNNGENNCNLFDEFNCILWNKNKFELITSGTFWMSDDPHNPGSKSWDTISPRNVVYGRFKRIDKDTQNNETSTKINENIYKRSQKAFTALNNTEDFSAYDIELSDSIEDLPNYEDFNTSMEENNSSYSLDINSQSNLDNFYVLSVRMDESGQARRLSAHLLREFIEQFLFEEEELEVDRLEQVPLFLTGNLNILNDSDTFSILCNGHSISDDKRDHDTEESDADSDETIKLYDLRLQESYSHIYTYTGFEDPNQAYDDPILGNVTWPSVPPLLSCKAIFPEIFHSPRIGPCSTDYILCTVPFKNVKFQIDERHVKETHRFPSDHRPLLCYISLD